MRLARRMKTPVYISTPTLIDLPTDQYGDEDPSVIGYWEVSASKAWIVPATSIEDETDRETVARMYDLYMRADTQIFANSEVTWEITEDDPISCRVIGAPQVYPTSMRGMGHMMVRVEGIDG